MLVYIFGLSYLLLFSVLEIAKRKYNIHPELTRKIAHIVSGIGASIFPYYISRIEIIVLALVFLLILGFSKKKKLFSSIHGQKKFNWGELAYPLAVAFAAYIYLPNNLSVYQMAILILAIADPFAFLIGIRSPKKSKLFNKSMTGSIAFLVVSFLIASSFVGIVPAIFIAIACTFAEAVSPYGFDNMTIVLATLVTLILI